MIWFLSCHPHILKNSRSTIIHTFLFRPHQKLMTIPLKTNIFGWWLSHPTTNIYVLRQERSFSMKTTHNFPTEQCRLVTPWTKTGNEGADIRTLQHIPKKHILGQSKSHIIHGIGIFTHIWRIFMVHVGKYTIHGLFGSGNKRNEKKRQNIRVCVRVKPQKKHQPTRLTLNKKIASSTSLLLGGTKQGLFLATNLETNPTCSMM